MAHRCLVTIICLSFMGGTRADCTVTDPPTLQVPVYQVAMNTPQTDFYAHAPVPDAPYNNATASTIYQISGMFASPSSTCNGDCLTQLDVLIFQNGSGVVIYTAPSSMTPFIEAFGFTYLWSLYCVATWNACGATIPLYGYENDKWSDQYVNTGFAPDAPSTDGYQVVDGGVPLCFLWVPPTTTSSTTTTTTTTNTPYTGPSTTTTTTVYTGPSTTTVTTTPYTGPTTTTTPYTGPSTTAPPTTVFTGTTTPYTGPSTTAAPTTPYTGPSITAAPTTAYTGPSTTAAVTTPYTGPSTTAAPTTQYTGPSTTAAPTTPYTGPSTTAAITTPYTGPTTTTPSTTPYTGPSTTASQTTIGSIGSKIGWPLIIVGVLVASLLIVAIIAGATWMFIRGGSSAAKTGANAYANQAHGYKTAHPDLPPQPVQPANAGVSTMNVGPTWTQPHSMYY